MGSYKLTKEAEADIIRIHQWGVRVHGEAKADEYFANFYACFEMLAQQPRLFPKAEHVRTGYRKCVCGVDTIYYRIIGDTVEIMNVLGQQDRDEWL
ncbi:MAG: type II toxin-antitoxin system RelE/ParE family toxin [Robiginitomaculum sp.]|nr:type II toxin-antitoxin system RelE/ParE family toxin [Robiginitomaculum sp.]